MLHCCWQTLAVPVPPRLWQGPRRYSANQAEQGVAESQHFCPSPFSEKCLLQMKNEVLETSSSKSGIPPRSHCKMLPLNPSLKLRGVGSVPSGAAPFPVHHCGGTAQPAQPGQRQSRRQGSSRDGAGRAWASTGVGEAPPAASIAPEQVAEPWVH